MGGGVESWAYIALRDDVSWNEELYYYDVPLAESTIFSLEIL